MCRRREMNPWLARFEQPDVFGAATMGVAGLGEFGVYELGRNHPKIAAVVNVGIGATFTAIAAHTARQGRR
jgi:hypothetical protein